MTAVLAAALAMALWGMTAPAGPSRRRLRAVMSGTSRSAGAARPEVGRTSRARSGRRGYLPWPARHGGAVTTVSMTVVVQQLSALLRGGRSSARLWEELWLLYAGEAGPGGPASGRERSQGSTELSGSSLSAESREALAAARAAAAQGSSVGAAIRRRASPDAGTVRGTGTLRGAAGKERTVWLELAACFDLAEASGCPLAEVLTRFAEHLEAADDAAAARQTALAGPKATVQILTWLPFLGLGLGMLLGVDAPAVLFGTSLGLTALGAGLALAAAGRIWSARLVSSAEGPGS